MSRLARSFTWDVADKFVNFSGTCHIQGAGLASCYLGLFFWLHFDAELLGEQVFGRLVNVRRTLLLAVFCCLRVAS